MSYNPSRANTITAAEMVYALKTKGAALFAISRTDSVSDAEILLRSAGELLKEHLFANNPPAADYLVDEAIARLNSI